MRCKRLRLWALLKTDEGRVSMNGYYTKTDLKNMGFTVFTLSFF